MTAFLSATGYSDVLAGPTARLPYQHNVLLRSYVLRHPTGTTVIYNSPGLTEAAPEITALGSPERLLINHAHEAMYGTPGLTAPIWAHEADAAEIGRGLDLAGTFDHRQLVDDGLVVIPTPGHTAGTTSYLWEHDGHRFLFTGDFIWIENGRWQAVVLDADLRPAYLDSLTLVRDLDFDVLVPWGVTEGDSPLSMATDPHDRTARIQAVIDRVAAGGSR